MPHSIGVMGGTFNPIHLGHLMAAQEARAQFHLDEIIFVPNNLPPHRPGESDLAPGEDRYMMVNLATVDNPYFQASRMELDRPEPSYTVDTITALKDARPRTDISFITGADAVLQHDWKGFDDLLARLAYFIVVTRSGLRPEAIQERIRALPGAHTHKMKVLPMPTVDISSTDIRRRLKEGLPITYFVSPAVEAYILKRGLYRQ